MFTATGHAKNDNPSYDLYQHIYRAGSIGEGLGEHPALVRRGREDTALILKKMLAEALLY